jgi:hypothetical protein
MDKLTNLVVDTSLTGNQLKEICISIGIKYYLPKAGCVERIKKRLAVVEKEEADRVVETNRGKKRETRQSLAKNNKKLKVETTKRITRATVKQSEERDDGDEDEEIIEDEEINDEQEDTGDNVDDVEDTGDYTVKNKKRLGRFFYEFVHFFKKSRHFLTSKVYMSLFKQKKSVLFIKISKNTY